MLSFLKGETFRKKNWIFPHFVLQEEEQLVWALQWYWCFLSLSNILVLFFVNYRVMSTLRTVSVEPVLRDSHHFLKFVYGSRNSLVRIQKFINTVSYTEMHWYGFRKFDCTDSNTENYWFESGYRYSLIRVWIQKLFGTDSDLRGAVKF